MTNRTDNFNRADSNTALGTPSDGGSAWVAVSGTWGILSNAAYKVNADNVNQEAYLESSVSDVDVQVTIASGTTQGPSIVARLADDNNYLNFLWLTDGVSLQMYKDVAGAFTQLGSTFTGTAAAGDVFKFTVNGSSLTAFLNGVSRITATDSAGSTNTKHGIRSFRNITIAHSFDDFSITALGGATTGAGLSAGTGAGLATGAAAKAGAGLSSGIATAIATGVSSIATSGLSSGTGAGLATGASANTGDMSAAGVGAGLAVGASTSGAVTGDGYAAGVGTATAQGAVTVTARGRAAGVGTARAVGAGGRGGSTIITLGARPTRAQLARARRETEQRDDEEDAQDAFRAFAKFLAERPTIQ